MPSDSAVKSYNETLCDVQSIFLHYCKLGTVIFAGDFNAQLDTDTRLPPNQKSKLLSAFIKHNGPSPLHEIFDSNAFSYVTARSRIDHVFIERSLSHIFTKYCVADPEDIVTSDHLPIAFEMNLRGERHNIAPKSGHIKNINRSKSTYFHLSQYQAVIESMTTKMFTTHSLENLTPDMINSAIRNILREAEKQLPQAKFNVSAKPYWCTDLKNAHAQARHFRSIWLQQGRPRGGQHQSYLSYKSAKRLFQRLQRQCIQKYENSVFDQLNRAADTDYRLFWKLL